jgi:hypothetical protein
MNWKAERPKLPDRPPPIASRYDLPASIWIAGVEIPCTHEEQIVACGVIQRAYLLSRREEQSWVCYWEQIKAACDVRDPEVQDRIAEVKERLTFWGNRSKYFKQ